jgi:peptide/nickel transport system substrate-binding protein
VDVGYGEAGRPTCNLVPAPEIYASDDTECATTYDPEAAMAFLRRRASPTRTATACARTRTACGCRWSTRPRPMRCGRTSRRSSRKWWEAIGFEVELRNIDAGVYFGGDPASPDTIEKFYADVEMYANEFEGIDPTSYLAAYTCDKIPSPATNWGGQNVNRVCDPAYEALLAEFQASADTEERGRLARAMNEYLTLENHVIIGLVHRGRVSGRGLDLGGVELNPYDAELWNAADWFRVE